MRLFARWSFQMLIVAIVFILLYRWYFQGHWRTASHAHVRIMYVVRTISKYHSSRLIHLLETWISLVDEHVYFVTDILLSNMTNTRTLSTEQTCGTSSHSVRSLCCQTAHDFILFRNHQSDYDWLCHFDDDQYVHVNNLQEYLATLDSNRPHYIGRNSWNSTFKRKKATYPGNFWFATLGAGMCLSKRAVQLLEPYTRTASQFADGCVREWYPDDIYLAFLLHNHLSISLTKNFRFHSHLERSVFSSQQDLIDTFDQQITFGFWLPPTLAQLLPDLFPRSVDPLRMRTLHCLLFTQLRECRRRLHMFVFKSRK